MNIPNREEVASSAMGDGNESRFVSFHSHAWSSAKWLTAARHPNVFLLFFCVCLCVVVVLVVGLISMYVCVCFVQTLQWLTPWRHPTASIQQSFTIADTCVMASSSTVLVVLPPLKPITSCSLLFDCYYLFVCSFFPLWLKTFHLFHQTIVNSVNDAKLKRKEKQMLGKRLSTAPMCSVVLNGFVSTQFQGVRRLKGFIVKIRISISVNYE